MIFEKTRNLPNGYCVSKLIKTLKKLKTYSLGNTPSGPSESESDSCPPTVFLDLIKYNSSSPAAAPCLPLCVIYPTFAPGVEPECILDGGAQIVVMRKDVWKRLQVPLVPNDVMPMESANATTTMALGVVEDYPIQLGPIKIFLQIQVVKEAPFEVLLGRPFFDVISCSEVSTPGGNHEI